MDLFKKLFTLPKTNFNLNDHHIMNFGAGCWPVRFPPMKPGEQWPEKLAHIFKDVDEYMIIDSRRKEGDKHSIYPEPVLACSYFRRRIIRKIAELESQGWVILPYY